VPESKFNKFVGKLKAEGYSNKSAHNIAAAKGAAKYGWHEMARRSAASRKRHEESHA
jgi:hypothetical protein